MVGLDCNCLIVIQLGFPWLPGRIMPYRLEVNPTDPQHPYLVEDDNGEDKLTVLFELLRFHIVRGNDHSRETERVLDDIAYEARREVRLW